MSKKRGMLLTTLIVITAFLTLLGFLATLDIASHPEKFAKFHNPSWFVQVSLLFTTLQVIYLVGLWNLKKWGVYLFTFYVLAGIPVGFMEPQLSFASWLISLTYLSLIGYAIWANWKRFK